MNRLFYILWSSLLYVIFCTGTNSLATVPSEVSKKLNDLQVPFIVNQGQTDTRVKFYAKTFGGTAYVTRRGEIVYDLPKVEGKKVVERWSLKEELIDAGIKAVEGEEKTITKVSYFTGNNRSHWHGDIPTYGLVTMGEVYKGIGFKLRANGNNMEKLFFVKPGAEPGEIRMKVSGARSLRTNDKGELKAETGLGMVVFTKPRAYQTKGDHTEEVDVAYAVDGASYGFTVGTYDKTRELVIDPLLQSTYLGGSRGAFADAIVVVGSKVYVAGDTWSTDFPGTTGGAQPVNHGGFGGDAFVALLSSDLKTLTQATYLGGNDQDFAKAIVVSGSNVYVAGVTSSTNFPGTAGGAQPACGGGISDGFVALLSSDLKTLTQATYLGGSNQDGAYALAVSGSKVYVAGYTGSTNFPGTAGGAQPANGGILGDAFVAVLSSDLKTLTQATYLGGNNGTAVEAIAVSGSNVYVAGVTGSTNFPGTVGGAQPAYGGGYSDGFVALLNSDLKTLTQATYLGGSNYDYAYAMAVSGSNVYVAGYTLSTDFPGTAGGAQPAYGGGYADAFVALLSSDLKTLTQATYLGGSGDDRASAIAMSDSKVYVAGNTTSTDFPGTAGGAQPANGGGYADAFVALLSSDLKTLTQATYLGGSKDDGAYAIAMSSSKVFVAGNTTSTNFPGTAGSAQPASGGDGDAVVALLTSDLRAPGEATSVPTMNEWGIILFMSLAGLGSAYYLKRRRTTES